VQARFRCQNEIGWSEFSAPNTLLLARPPSAPPKPHYLSSDGSSITLHVLPALDSGGAPILAHEVWTEEGGVLTKDSSYDGVSASHTLSGLTAGAVYRTAVRAENVVGFSDWSEYLEIAASELPAAPAANSVRKIVSLSSKSSIYLEWDKVLD
jgi:hypothetical protein